MTSGTPASAASSTDLFRESIGFPQPSSGMKGAWMERIGMISGQFRHQFTRIDPLEVLVDDQLQTVESRLRSHFEGLPESER